MTFFKFKNYCLFILYICFSISVFFALARGIYLYALIVVIIIGSSTFRVELT